MFRREFESQEEYDQASTLEKMGVKIKSYDELNKRLLDEGCQGFDNPAPEGFKAFQVEFPNNYQSYLSDGFGWIEDQAKTILTNSLRLNFKTLKILRRLKFSGKTGKFFGFILLTEKLIMIIKPE